jgi:integrase/recombinase XerD
MEFWAQRTISPFDGQEGWTVVDNCYVEHVRVAEYLRSVLDRGGSVGTARTYAGRLALWLGWTSAGGLDESSPSVEQVAAFARWLERTPSRKHRRGRHRRRAEDTNVVTLQSARSPATVDGIVAAVVEFIRFGVSRQWCEPMVAGQLSSRVELRFIPAGLDRGEQTSLPVVQRRAVRRRRVERPPATLTAGQVGLVVDACVNVRDRFVVEALYATGVRVSELCGLRLADLHLLPSAVHLGCQVAGAHMHVVRREDNENRALAKSIWPRVLPVTRALVRCHNAYRFERDAVPAAAESDYLLVNLWRPPLGRALSPDAVEQLFVRLSSKVGFHIRPHMLRHSFASEVALTSKDPALVKELLGHASVRSTDVYLHARWDDMRKAVDAHDKSTRTPR